MNPIICSYASKGREDYNEGLLRLIDSVKEHWNGDTYFHSLDGKYDQWDGIKITRGELLSPIAFHYDKSIPYFFKFVIIHNLREKGYEKIIWLDSSLVLVKNPLPLLEGGIMAFDNLGHPLYKYISDKAVKNLKCENELYNIKQIWGGAVGFDFSYKFASELFAEIIKQAFDGSFNEGKSTREGFVAHRHDQSVMSVLFHNKVQLHPYGRIVTHPHYLPPYEYENNFYIVHKPII